MAGSRMNGKGSAGSSPPRRLRRSLDELPRFDPGPSIEAGVRILRAIEAPFALAGRVAVWTYVPPEGQVFTDEVDFAMPCGYAEAIEEAARERGHTSSGLAVGGVKIRNGEIAVNFIDGQPHVAALFADAVKAAECEGDRIRVGETETPVVPKQYLIAMKLASFREGDERDVEELLKTVSAQAYREIKGTVVEYLGYAMGNQLDRIARRIGHAGVEPRYGK